QGRLCRGNAETRRHCERSEAIQSFTRDSGLLRRLAPRNDNAKQLFENRIGIFHVAASCRVGKATTSAVAQRAKAEACQPFSTAKRKTVGTALWRLCPP